MKNYQKKAIEHYTPKKEFQTATVKDYMVFVDQLITFQKDSEIMEVVETLLRNRITGAPVLDEDGKILGMIDDKDCLKVIFDSAYYDQPKDTNKVEHFMSGTLRTVSDKSDIYDVANIFLTSIFKRLLVIDDDGRLVGQISRRDILRAIHDMNLNAV